MQRRWILFVALLAASVAVSVAATIYLRSPIFALLLLFPSLPFLFRRDGTAADVVTKECAMCGFTTQDPRSSFCPRDGSALRPPARGAS
jgi:hypothetical protein